MSGLNFLDTTHASTSGTTIGFSASFDQAFPGSGTTGSDRPILQPGSAAAEFKNNIQIALTQHLPQLMSLAQAVVDGVDRAYEPDVNPNKTANDYASLALLTSQFYEFLRETGIGALPMIDAESNSGLQPAGTSTDGAKDDDMAVDLPVGALPTANAVSNMSEDELRTSLNATVNAQYLRERRVAENASVVFNRLTKSS